VESRTGRNVAIDVVLPLSKSRSAASAVWLINAEARKTQRAQPCLAPIRLASSIWLLSCTSSLECRSVIHSANTAFSAPPRRACGSRGALPVAWHLSLPSPFSLFNSPPSPEPWPEPLPFPAPVRLPLPVGRLPNLGVVLRHLDFEDLVSDDRIEGDLLEEEHAGSLVRFVHHQAH